MLCETLPLLLRVHRPLHRHYDPTRRTCRGKSRRTISALPDPHGEAGEGKIGQEERSDDRILLHYSPIPNNILLVASLLTSLLTSFLTPSSQAYESPFSPALEVMPASEGEGEGFEPATMMINGPACFGGCTELCCER